MHPIVLRGAHTHNLKGVDLDLRQGELVTITGPSGAGKSSLALDTLYSEGQRRFVESFSPYARQFLERLERPPIDSLDPVAAGVAVDRRAPVKSSRSTVATMTDIEPYFSALFVREALPVCPDCGVLAERSHAAEAADNVSRSHNGALGTVTYRLVIKGVETYLDVRDSLVKAGYRKLFVRGEARDLDDVPPTEALGGGLAAAVDVVVDRVKIGPQNSRRLGAAIEEAWQRGGGSAALHVKNGAAATQIPVARGLACPSCAKTFDPPRPGLFSYQSPVGACPECRGFGRTIGIDWNRVIPDEGRTIKGRAIRPWSGKASTWERSLLRKYCDRVGIPLDKPWRELSPEQRQGILEGEGDFESGLYPGVRRWFAWLETRTYKMHVRVLLARYRSYDPCAACGGKRLSKESLGYRVGGIDLGAFHAFEMREAYERLEALKTVTGQGEIARKELLQRLGYLVRVGLGYLTLDRQARTLSGGEAQRVSLTSALGTSLTGALFVLDEPTVGLHPTDVPPLVSIMRELAQAGNVVVSIEHDPLVINASDRVIELGPGAGPAGGRIVFDGDPEAFAARHRADDAASDTHPRAVTDRGRINIVGACANNLKNVTVDIPLGVVVAVTGPSGSGKSSLVDDILYRALAKARGYRDIDPPGAYEAIRGATSIRTVFLVDQAPLGRTSRGNPATYTGAWDRVRALFGKEPESLARGFSPAHFSFNVAAGRCEDCAGEGAETVEMQFLADVSLSCPTCQGRRFRADVLEVKHRGKSVADVLELSVDAALELFAHEAAIVRALGPLAELGLGYLALGQPLSTLSGGEAQRIKLAHALAANLGEGALLVLDEPSAGLHRTEVRRINRTLRTVARAGASVVVVDHDLDVVAAADWVIDLGPGAGEAGGHVVAQGTPEQVAQADTRTGQALRGWGRSTPLGEGVGRPAMLPAPRAIHVVNAREHNLRDVSVELPLGQIVVVTGPSGSGKSTLAFDVVFAEGQRRFLETLTPYARQFLPTLPRPDVDRVTAVPPSIALEQRTTRSGSNSTVATVTEVAHYLRLLYAKVGEPHCPSCDGPIVALRADAVYQELLALRGPQVLLAPAVVSRKGTYLDVFASAARAGIETAVVDGDEVSTDKPPKLKKSILHTIDLVLFRGKLAELPREAFDRAIALGRGSVKVRGTKGELFRSTTRACPTCGISVPELDPRWFSFNTKQGRCEACEGTGLVGGTDADPQVARPCKVCSGSRLAPVPRAVRLGGLRYHEAVAMPVIDATAWARGLGFGGAHAMVAEAPMKELLRRLDVVLEVGLGYLSLDRRATSLSGGEMQRLRLAAQLGSGLTGALYVLDEPTVGLHPRDTARLLDNLRKLARSGSTVLLVEHDADTIRAADFLVDLGPSGGRGGGRIIAAGPPAEVLANPESPTARALAEEGNLVNARACRGGSEVVIELRGVRANNLNIEAVSFPVGRMTVVAGVSGSGKSTLVQKVLYPAVRAALGLVTQAPGAHDSLRLPKVPSKRRSLVAPSAAEPRVMRAALVDQSPIGRTPRSVPATFLGIWDEVRKIFAASPDAKVRGYGPARFSFNSAAAGGRCPVCEGNGVIAHEMSFLPDVTTTCAACFGRRFEPATADVRYRGLSIGEALDLTAEEAADVFSSHPKIKAALTTMCDLGIGYLHLGQGSHTLSGGEAQRLKLANELTAGARHEPTLYVLDEPTTGLHLADVVRLIAVLDRLVARGDTLVIIEHHPVVIASADHIVELGPEGGAAGGQIVAEGTPREVARELSATGRVLHTAFAQKARATVRRTDEVPI